MKKDLKKLACVLALLLMSVFVYASISGPIDELEFDTSQGQYPDLVNLGFADDYMGDADAFLVAYTGPDNDGWLKTVAINSSGEINPIDSYEFASYRALYPNLVHVSSLYYGIPYHIYAIAYTGFDDDGWLKTFEFLGDGTVLGNLDVHEFDTDRALYPDIIKLNCDSEDYYAIVYTGLDDDGWLKTVAINSSGEINPIDSYEFASNRGLYPEIIPIYNNVYAIVYTGYHDDGYVRTLRIPCNGSIRYIDGYEFDTDKALNPDIISVSLSGNPIYYAIAYTGVDDDGWVKTVKIFTNGTIVENVVDSYEFDTVNGVNPKITNVPRSSSEYGIVYTGKDDDGYLKLVRILTNGSITGTTENLEFDTSNGLTPDGLTYVADFRMHAIAYTTDDSDGNIVTIDIPH